MKILLADDSMTAQNMGKKILADAGYNVIAVSNGAAAIKKIASEKPDLLILDQFMPGYTGSEICQKVKGAPATANIPIIITVGKMEPFKSEEGAKVGADAVIVKPFEATDLIAVVKKMTQKAEAATAKAAKAAESERTQKLPRMDEEKDETYEQWKVEEPEPVEETTKNVGDEMSQEMGAASAFDDPMPEPTPAASTAPASGSQASPWFSAPVTSALEANSTSPPAWSQPSAVVEDADVSTSLPPPAGSAPSFEVAAPTREKTASWEITPSPVVETAAAEVPANVAPELGAASSSGFEAAAPAEVPAAAAAPPEFEPTAAAPVEVKTGRAAGFEPTILEESPEPTVTRDPALVTDASTMVAEFATKFGVENPEPIPVGIAADFEPAPAADAAPAESVEAAATPSEAAPAESGSDFGADSVASPFEAAPPPPPEAPPAVDHEFAAALGAAISDAPIAAPEPQQAAPPIPEDWSSPEAAVIAAAVERVLARLKGELIAEITRELKR